MLVLGDSSPSRALVSGLSSPLNPFPPCKLHSWLAAQSRQGQGGVQSPKFSRAVGWVQPDSHQPLE